MAKSEYDDANLHILWTPTTNELSYPQMALQLACQDTVLDFMLDKIYIVLLIVISALYVML